jgi:hypothetical protein
LSEDRRSARARRAAAWALLFLGASACGRKTSDAPVESIGASTHDAERPVEFSFDSLDARRVNDEALRGKPTVLAFVATWDLASQAQIDFMVPMHKHDGTVVNYIMIALQEPKDREIVEAFRSGLHVEFPVALADKGTIAGGGPFGDVHNVPTVVILDRAGRMVWRRVGLARSDEIRAGFKGL